MKFINESRLIELIYLVFYDYLIERFSEVLNVQHHYSIFHLKHIFPCKIYERRTILHIALHLDKIAPFKLTLHNSLLLYIAKQQLTERKTDAYLEPEP